MVRSYSQAFFALYILLVLLAAACSTQSVPTDMPTQPVIPSTPTDTPTPITPTATPPFLPGPRDVATATPSDEAPAVANDPIASELVLLARRRVAQELDLPVRRVRLEEVTSLIWTDSSLGCPQAGQRYVPVQVSGYRIVLSVGDKQYIFHSDTERLSPCAATNERLPQEITPEATPPVESTPEATSAKTTPEATTSSES